MRYNCTYNKEGILESKSASGKTLSGYELKADNKIKTKNGNGITTRCHGKGKSMS
ncbi:hypothetical protein [Clostridium sp. OS1-26]|uniref:hypothetical protein n=1 Tax=Clostridium sp. OS1-26 TaxID=3070681 RepID=UPI0027E06A74|nr:hypothetical protein [Clostridium sp. OS1-26]WML33914.1 hypothetical protein RCG18_21705 [Clostridium sp. OS1-26]